ncbi:hypothetical protein BT63DRAFT_457128 [Microthyrium microscopicum]|uniref:Uncharacterized protein n=1 Tax=Microthyrium microscopicum TaxID=703497 RepID=A0A6A6U8Q5_9PEZI|nr:hypothetical protein BT63DRAFT_457128 [Microthyrium microscopicum]
MAFKSLLFAAPFLTLGMALPTSTSVEAAPDMTAHDPTNGNGWSGGPPWQRGNNGPPWAQNGGGWNGPPWAQNGGPWNDNRPGNNNGPGYRDSRDGRDGRDGGNRDSRDGGYRDSRDSDYRDSRDGGYRDSRDSGYNCRDSRDRDCGRDNRPPPRPYDDRPPPRPYDDRPPPRPYDDRPRPYDDRGPPRYTTSGGNHVTQGLGTIAGGIGDIIGGIETTILGGKPLDIIEGIFGTNRGNHREVQAEDTELLNALEPIAAKYQKMYKERPESLPKLKELMLAEVDKTLTPILRKYDAPVTQPQAAKGAYISIRSCPWSLARMKNTRFLALEVVDVDIFCQRPDPDLSFYQPLGCKVKALRGTQGARPSSFPPSSE